MLSCGIGSTVIIVRIRRSNDFALILNSKLQSIFLATHGSDRLVTNVAPPQSARFVFTGQPSFASLLANADYLVSNESSSSWILVKTELTQLTSAVVCKQIDLFSTQLTDLSLWSFRNYWPRPNLPDHYCLYVGEPRQPGSRCPEHNINHNTHAYRTTISAGLLPFGRLLCLYIVSPYNASHKQPSMSRIQSPAHNHSLT